MKPLLILLIMGCLNFGTTKAQKLLDLATLHETIVLNRAVKNIDPKPFIQPLLLLKENQFYQAMILDGKLTLPNVTTECFEDFSLIAAEVMNLTDAVPGFSDVFAQMKDSMGSQAPGFLRLTRTFYGFKQECDVIRYSPPNRARDFRTAYSRAYLSLTGNCTELSLQFDICLPKSCTSNDLMEVVDYLPSIMPDLGAVPICTITTLEDVKTPLGRDGWITLAIIIILATLGVLAGIIDYLLLEPENPIRKSPGVQAFLAFSIYTNVNEILRAPKTREGQIGPFNCIRAISMLWVMFGHVIQLFIAYNNNILDFEEILDYPLTQLAENAFFSVDSFFFIGGVLLSFMWFKSYYKNKKATMAQRPKCLLAVISGQPMSGFLRSLNPNMYTVSRDDHKNIPSRHLGRCAMAPQAWGMFYLHRIIRISAPYYMLLIFYVYILPVLMNDSLNKLAPYPPEENLCRKNIWKSFLYFANLIDASEICVGHTWYLAADMQMFILTPLILVPLALYPILGLIIAFIALILSTAGNVITVYLNHYPPTFNILGPVDPKMTNYDLYFKNMYYAFWIRCQVYIMGIIVGWVLQRVKRLRIHPLINLLGWALSFALMLTVVFGLFHYFRGHQLPLFWRAAYSALSKPAWALGLTWIVISCYYGYGGPINRFMSWNIWAPLGKLSFTAYLVHAPLAMYLFSLPKNALYFSSMIAIIANFLAPLVMFTFGFALILSALVEVPAGKLETLLLRPKPHQVKPTKKEEIMEGSWDVKQANGHLAKEKIEELRL